MIKSRLFTVDGLTIKEAKTAMWIRNILSPVFHSIIKEGKEVEVECKVPIDSKPYHYKISLNPKYESRCKQCREIRKQKHKLQQKGEEKCNN